MSASQLLVVDDDARYAASVCELLRFDGHAAAFEVDGGRALERIHGGGIGVLILDLDMPGMSGLDVLQALHTRTESPKTIIVSGIDDLERIEPALHFGPFDYLVKPYEPKALLTSVRSAMTSIRRHDDEQVLIAEQAVARATGGIAHDFNNILADVIGYTELSLGSATTVHLKEVLAAGQRARDLISQILMLTRRDGVIPDGLAPPTHRVVIVDHEISVGDCIADVLKRAGCRVAVFNDAAAAFEHLDATPDDAGLVLVDQGLPPGGGAQFALRLRALPAAPPVVIMAGYADRTEPVCAPVLNKPFCISELLAVVAKSARRSAAVQ